MAEPVGPGPPGLAHRVLGDGAPLPRRAVRHPRRRRRPDLPAPRERDRAVRGRVRRRQLRAPLDALRLLNFGGEKMSKSLGNIVTIRKVAETHDLEALRLLFLGVHYRSPVGFTLGARRPGAARLPGARRGRGAARLLLPDAGASWRRRPAGDDGGAGPAAQAEKTLSVFQEAMDDDFNTAAAIGHLYEVVRAGEQVARRAEGGGQGRAPPDAGAPAPRPARVRRDAGDLPARRRPRSCWRAATRHVRAAGIDAAAVEAQIAGARRRARRQGLRPRRRDPRSAPRAAASS